jgi:uncharacterized membrane protein YdjX (TVP38/TMEM64 family)
MTESKGKGWILLGGATLALILVPFILWGAAIEHGFDAFVQTAGDRSWVTAAVLGGLLASDVLLPIPSSLVSTSSGLMLGFIAGTLVSLAGMTVSCLAAYWLGMRGGRPLGRRLIGEREIARLESFHHRFGDWLIIVARPVPVLAEASTLFAGMGRMAFHRYLSMTLLANLGISAAYAAVGAFAGTRHSFLLAFAGAILLPLAAISAIRYRLRHRRDLDPHHG